MDRSERSAHDGRQGEGTAGSDPDTAAGAADAANQTARAAGKRAGQMVDVAKLNVQLFD